MEISRHGYRSAGYIFPLTVDPEENFTVPYNLTMTGAQMHYDMGKDFVRANYMLKESFLSETYDPSEVYALTSDT